MELTLSAQTGQSIVTAPSSRSSRLVGKERRHVTAGFLGDLRWRWTQTGPRADGPRRQGPSGPGPGSNRARSTATRRAPRGASTLPGRGRARERDAHPGSWRPRPGHPRETPHQGRWAIPGCPCPCRWRWPPATRREGLQQARCLLAVGGAHLQLRAAGKRLQQLACRVRPLGTDVPPRPRVRIARHNKVGDRLVHRPRVGGDDHPQDRGIFQQLGGQGSVAVCWAVPGSGTTHASCSPRPPALPASIVTVRRLGSEGPRTSAAGSR
jgi:hypothetical protein